MFSEPSSKVQFQIIEHIVTEIDLLEQHAVLDTVYIRQLVRRTVQSNQILRQSQKSKLVMLALQLYQRGEMLQIQWRDLVMRYFDSADMTRFKIGEGYFLEIVVLEVDFGKVGQFVEYGTWKHSDAILR